MGSTPSDFDFVQILGIRDNQDTSSASAVRSEYERVVPHILNLCRDFGLDPQAMQSLNLAALMRSLECLDRYYDAITDDKQAERFVQDVFLFLQTQEGILRSIRPVVLPDDLTRNLVTLREVLHQTQSMQDFMDHTSALTRLSRQAREITDIREYIRSSLLQGEIMGELVLKVLDFPEAPEHFSNFMIRVAAAGNLFDDYFDAHMDHASGQLAIKPGFMFKAAFQLVLTEKAAWIAAHHPNKPRALQIMRKFHF